jgi:hypothetical protein
MLQPGTTLRSLALTAFVDHADRARRAPAPQKNVA